MLASAHRLSDGIPTVATHPLTPSSVISVPIPREILLPAYLNDVMKEYKATTHRRSGRSFGILCRGDCLPPTYTVPPFS